MDFLGRIRKLDSSLQRGLDNSFALVFGGKIVPNELEECLKQEIEDFLMQDANGVFLAPNSFRIGVSQKDFQNLKTNEPQLPAQLTDRLNRYCRNNGWSLPGEITLEIQEVSSLHTGQLKTASHFDEQASGRSQYYSDANDESASGTEAGSTDSAASNNTSTSSAATSGSHIDDSQSYEPRPDSQPSQPYTGQDQSDADHSYPGTDSSQTEYAYREPEVREPEVEVFGTASRPVQVPAAAQVPPSLATSGSASSAPVQREGHEGYAQYDSVPYDSVPSAHVQQPTRGTTVTLLLQDGSNRQYEVRPGSNVIGRGTASDFRLPDTGVSRQHAEITWDGRDAILVDLHSTNGTVVNDGPIESWLLADGDVISIGHSVLEVRIR